MSETTATYGTMRAHHSRCLDTGRAMARNVYAILASSRDDAEKRDVIEKMLGSMTVSVQNNAFAAGVRVARVMAWKDNVALLRRIQTRNEECEALLDHYYGLNDSPHEPRQQGSVHA